MKFIRIFCCLFFLLVLGGENLCGQQWLWAEPGLGTNSTGAAPLGIATSPLGNVLEVGEIDGSMTFGSKTISSANPSVRTPYMVNYSSTGNVIWAITGYSNAWGAICAVAANATGEIYVTGFYTDTLTFGSLSVKTNYISNTFVAKFDPNGHVLWMRSCDPTENENAGDAITIDKAGNIIVTGYYSNNVSFGLFYLPGISYAYNNAFVVKYDSSGNILWANSGTATGSVTNGIFSESVTTDSSDNVYIAGTMQGTGVFGTFLLPVGRTAYANTFIAKYDSNGNIQWAAGSKILGGGSTGWRDATLTCDIYNNIYLSGTSSDTVMFGRDSLISGGAFLVKYNPNSDVIWAKNVTRVSHTGSTEGLDVSSDKWGHIYWSGFISEFDTCFIGGMLYEAPGYIFNYYTVKMDTSGKTVCGEVNNAAYNTYFMAADKVAPNVCVLGNVIGPGTYSFGKYIVTGDGDPWPILAKWTCDTCTIPIIISATYTTICPGQNTVLYASGSVGYIWSDGSTNDSTVVSPIVSTTYSVFIGNGNCSGMSSIRINVNPVPTPLFTYNNKICFGKTDTIIASGGINYKWSNGDTNSSIIVNPVSNTTYTVSISNGLCSVNDSVSVQVFPYPIPSISDEQYLCPNQSATITASGGSIYLWNTGDTTSTITVNPISNTTYTVSISNGNCAVIDSGKVIVNPAPNSNVCCDSLITYGGSVQLISSGGQSYQWSPNIGLSCDICPNPIAKPGYTTIYTLTITSDSGCTASRTVTIEVTCGDVFVPDAFSPNQDGHNDRLYVRGPCIASMDFNVFDRWGHRIFESQNLDYGWDGMYKGLPANPGTYLWYVKATMLDGTSVEKHGNVALVR